MYLMPLKLLVRQISLATLVTVWELTQTKYFLIDIIITYIFNNVLNPYYVHPNTLQIHDHIKKVAHCYILYLKKHSFIVQSQLNIP